MVSNLINTIARLCNNWPGKILVLLVWWILWPGLMFLVGSVLESRRIPIGGRQSRAFLPGDLCFGPAFVSLISMYTDHKPSFAYDPKWWMILSTFIGLIAWLLRKLDCANYTKKGCKGACASPTKITHDVVGYFMIPTILTGLAVPKLRTLDANWIIFAVSILGYAACVTWDNKLFPPDSYTTELLNYRHPSKSKPIWRR